jgi:hypothetical protein
MALTFAPATHTYTLDGTIVPSVTQILRASGLVDFSSVPPTILEAARRRGTAVHQAIHYYNENDLDVHAFCASYPDYAGYLEAWLAFVAERKFVAHFNEYRVASHRHELAGTIDCLGVLEHQGALIDFATGRPEDAAKDLQTAAYHALAHETAEHDPALGDFLSRYVIRRYAVALKRDGRFTVEAYTDPADWRRFQTLREAQRIIEARRGPRALESAV